MSDYNSSLPVRTQNNGDVVINIADGTTTSQLMSVDASGRITIKLDDGAGNAVTSQANGAQRALDVGINVAGVQIDPRSIRALTAADVVTADQGGSWSVSLLAGSATIGAVTQASGPWTMNLTQIGGSAIALGQALMAASVPVVLASNQSAIPVSQSGTWNVGLSAGSNNIGSVNQGTSPWITSDLSDGSVSGGSAGTYSALIGGIYNSSLPTLTTGQQAAIQVDSNGRVLLSPLTTSSVIKVDLQDGSGNSLSSTSGSLNVAVQSIAAGSNIIGKVELTDGTNTVGVAPASTAASATQPAEVVALSPNSPLPAGTNALGSVLANLQVASAAVSSTNPVPVTISSSSPGTPVQNYQTSASLAAGSSVTLTYTVATGHTFNLQRIWASASGKIKAVVQNGSSTIFVGFNSTANPNIDITVIEPPLLAAASTVNVIITNEDKAPFDVYCTIEGNQN